MLIKKQNYFAYSSLLIVLIGLTLQLVLICSAPFEYDEYFYPMHGLKDHDLIGLLGALIYDWHPPAYPFLLWLWVNIFGDSELVMRLPNIIFSVAMLWFVYKSGKYISNSRVSLIWLTILSISLATLEAVYQARSYMMLMFGATAMLYYFLLAFNKISQSTWQKKERVALIVATVFLAHIHYISVFYIASVYGALITICYFQSKYTREIAKVSLISVAIILPWYCIHLFNIYNVGGYYSWLNLLSASSISFKYMTFLSPVATMPFSALIYIFCFTILLVSYRKKSTPAEAIAVLVLLSSILLAVLFSIWTNVIHSKTLLVFAPLIYLIFAVGVNKVLECLERYKQRILKNLVLMYLLVFYVFYIYTNYETRISPAFNKSDYKMGKAIIENNPQCKTVPIITIGDHKNRFNYLVKEPSDWKFLHISAHETKKRGWEIFYEDKSRFKEIIENIKNRDCKIIAWRIGRALPKEKRIELFDFLGIKENKIYTQPVYVGAIYWYK